MHFGHAEPLQSCTLQLPGTFTQPKSAPASSTAPVTCVRHSSPLAQTSFIEKQVALPSSGAGSQAAIAARMRNRDSDVVIERVDRLMQATHSTTHAMLGACSTCSSIT